VAFDRGFTGCDARGAQLTWDGIVATSAFPISDGFLFEETSPAPSSPLDAETGPRPWLVTYVRYGAGSPSDIVVRVMSGASTLASANLSALEGLDPGLGQHSPEADSNGQRFVVTYGERDASGSTDSFLATVACAEGAIRVDEVHVPIETGPASTYGSVAIAGCITTSNQGVEWHAVAWGDSLPIAGDLYCGAYYEPDHYDAYCLGDGSYGDCPCSNLGTTGGGCANSLTQSGVLAPAGYAFASADSFALTVSDLPSTVPCLFFQGTAATAPGVAFGDGLRCASGTTIRIGSKTTSGGVASYPEPGDLPISVRGGIPTGGAQRFYQSWYRNAADFCTSATFNTTNGVNVRWLR